MAEVTTKTKQPGTYDHTDAHTAVYKLMNVGATDTPIDRAWARLYDQGWDAGPAISKPFLQGEKEVQYFLYAKATRDMSESNVNLVVDFSFGGSVFITRESGL